MENEPRLSEINLKQLQHILLNAPAAIAVYEMPEFKYILANKAYEKLTNRKAADLLGKSFRNVFPELNGTGTFELFDTILINGESFTDPEYPAIVDIKNDGVLQQCYFNFSMEPLKNDAGEIYAMVATTCDITEQVEARKKVEDTETQFKNVLLLSPNIFVILEGFPEMIITFANEPLFKSWGKTASIIGQPLMTVLPEIEDQPFPKLLQQVFETGKTYNSKEEKAVIIKNGAPVDTYFVYVYQPIFNDAHKVTGVTVMATDITEQVIARKASEESEYLYHEMIYSSPFMISILKGENMIIEIANDTILSSWGKEKEVIGKSIFDVMPEVIEQGFDKLLLNVYRTGEPFLANETPVTFLRNGVNKIIYYNFVYQAHRDIDGAIVGVAILANEVTSSVELNNKRKENEKQKTFLLNFSDKLRAESTVDAVANSALQMLSEYLKLDRCYIGVYQLTEDCGVFPYQVGNELVPPMPASVRLSDFPDALRVAFDHTLVIDDVTKAEGLADTDRQNLGALGLCALVAATLRHGENNPLWSIVSVSASPRQWTSSEIKLIEEVTERTWAALERAKAEEALRKSEEKYRSLFDSIDEGVNTIEIIFDENEKAIDFRFLESNPAMTKASGLTSEILGKTAKEVLPNIEEFWLETYERVVKTGEPIRFEYTIADLNSNWFEVHAYRVGDKQSRKIITVYNNITDRKNEQEKQTYVLQLSDAIKELNDPVDIQLTACRILGEHVKVNRVLFGEVINEEQICISNNYVNGVAAINATLSAEQFGKHIIDAFKRNEKINISDITTDCKYSEEEKRRFLDLDVVANVGLGLIKDGRWVATFGMHNNAPRKWTATEIWLLEETAERTWAAVETAKAEEALRKSEEKYRTLFTSIDQGLVLCELVRDKEGKGIDYYMLELNPTYESQTGISLEMVLGKTILQVFPTIEKGHIDTFAAVVDDQCPIIFEQYFEVNHRWHEVKVYPGEKDRFNVLFSDITERKQAENKIKESEQEVRKIKEQLELSIRAGKIGIWHWDVKKDLLYWSKEQNDIYGICDSEKITCSAQFNALIIPEDLKRIQDEQNEGNNLEHEYDFRIARKNDGAIRWIKSRARNVLDLQGVLQSISGVNIDVTDQVLALNKIQESEEKFKRLILQAPVAICVLRGQDYVIETINEGMCTLWDRTLLQALNKPVFDVIPEVRDQGIKELLDSVYFTGEPCIIEELSVNIMRKGVLENAFVKFVYEPIREADGTVSGVMALAHEITEQVLARKNVEESEKKFEAAILAVAGIIWTNNAKGEMMGDQPGWSKLTGQSYEEYEGYGWTKAIHPDDAQPTIDAWNHAVATNSTFEFEHRVQTAQNEWRLFSVKAVPAFDDNKAIQQWVGVHTDITEQKIAQEKLAYRTALLEAHNEASIDGILLVDARGKILSYNQRFVELWDMPQSIVNDYDDEAGLLFAVSQLVYPEQFIDKVKYLYDHPNETSFDELEMKNGKIIERNGYSVFGEDGKYYARSWTFKDITKRKKIEQDLKNTKEQLELTFKHIPAGVYLINAKGEMVYVNDKGASVYGDFTPEYMLEHNDLATQLKIADELFERYDENGNYFSALDSPAFISLTTGKSSQAILKQTHKISRQQRWYYVQGAPLFDEKGNVSLVLITSTDITEQKNAEEKIKHSEERFRSLAETLPQMVWVLSSNGEMEYASKNWKHYSGIDDVTEAWNYMTHPDDREDLTAYWNKILLEKKGFKHEVRLKNKEGVYHWFYSVGEPVMDVHGKIIKWVGSLTDTQEQKEVAEKLMQAKVSAENAAKSRQQFLSNMSHEIRTPLNSIIGFTNVLIKTKLDEKQKEFVEAIKTSGRSLNLLINDILDLAKVDAGKMTFEKEPFEMQKSINVALHSFDLKIKEKNLELIKNYDSKIPAILLGDSVRLNQIILNLTSNAVKFTHTGKITISIRLLNEDAENVNIEFVVTDTGIGIAESKINSVFNVFEQSENSTFNSYGGTGLGLAIVKQLIEEQGGTIDLISKLGQGSTFTFMMPFGKTILQTQQKIEIPTVHSAIKNLRILVAEDVALNQMLIKIILNDFGFEYEIVDNGKLAIEKMQTNTYDIILMDLQMPEMNGFEATEYIRKTLKSAIPIIALTADVTTVDVVKCQKFGMDGYISKPINENLLYSKIVELVQNKH